MNKRFRYIISDSTRLFTAGVLIAWSHAALVAADVSFTEEVIDSGFYQFADCKSVGDIDGDGLPDVVIGGGLQLNWYRYPAWTKTSIATANNEFTTDMQVGDVDGDGDLDIIVPDGPNGNNLLWFENPRPAGNPATASWTRHEIGATGGYCHDLAVGDLNGDGHLDVVARQQNAATCVFFQNTTIAWSKVTLTTADDGEGTTVGDIDRDGDLDVVQNGYWLQNPLPGGNPLTGSAWTKRTINGNWPVDVGVATGDVNNDGRLDVVLAHAESTGRMVWYESPVDPINSAWVEHLIDASVDYAHTFKTADINGDGQLDVVFAEMQQSSRKRVGFYLNGGSGLSWQLQVLSTSGSHNIRVADFGNDGDIDIVGANWQGSPIEWWENKLDPGGLGLGSWTYKQVTAAHTRTFSLCFPDVDADGDLDIASGRYVYRNPGSPMTGAWTQTALPGSAHAFVTLDVDGDNLSDLIAQQDNVSGSRIDIYWIEAANTTATSWSAPILIGNVPRGNEPEGFQGYAIAQVVAGGLPEIIVNSPQGLYYFAVPASNPGGGNWPRTLIAANNSEEGIGVADIDGDGDLDISFTAGGVNEVKWARNPGNGTGSWSVFVIGTFAEADWPDRCAAADLNGDGQVDIIVTEENSGSDSDALACWWEQPAGGATSANWVRHTIATQYTMNSLDVGDVDKDGDLDLVLAEHRGTKRIAVWQNDGQGNFTEKRVDEGRESHLGARLADLDHDDDLDLISIAYDAFDELHLWRNDSSGTTPPGASGITFAAGASAVDVDGNSSASLSFAHGALTEGYVVVGVSMYDPVAGAGITAATYGGLPMTLLGTVQDANAYSEVYLFGLAVGNKAAGSYNVVLTASTGIDQLAFGVSAFSGVSQTAPTGPVAMATGSSTTASVAVTSAAGDLVVDILGQDDGTSTLGANQTQNWRQEDSTDRADGVSSREPATGATTTMSYQESVASSWSLGAIALKSGGPPPDTTRPTLTSVTAVNANTVQVLFSEPVATTSAQTPGNYGLNNGVTISAAVLGADTRTVTLTTSTLAGGSYMLTVNNVTDRASPPNPINPNSPGGFSFVPDSPPPGASGITFAAGASAVDVDGNSSASLSFAHGALTEGYVVVGVSMYDPVAGAGITAATYGGLPMTLLGTVQDANAYSEVYLFGLAVGNKAAGSYNVVLTASTGIDQLAFGVSAFSGVSQTAPTGPVAMATGSSTTASVAVTSAAGDLVVDILGQDDGTSTLGANQTQNWRQEDSTDRADGVSSREPATGATTTMSYQESVASSWSLGAIALKSGGPPPDTTRPTLTSVTAVNANTVQVLFSEPVATTSAQTPGNYGLNNGVTISAAVLGADTRTVTLTTSTLAGGSYMLTVNNVTDRATPANTIVANSQTAFSFTPSTDTTPPTTPGSLTGTGTSANTVQLAWQASSDNVGVTEYRISRNGTLTGTAPGTETSYQDTGLTAATTYAYSVVARDAVGNTSPAATVTATTQAGGGSTAVVRVNAGGGAFVDTAGNSWSADFGFNNGNTGSGSAPISGTMDDTLYQSDRWSSTLAYSFTLPNGDYTVNLHFAEIWDGAFAVGARVFDVSVEGQLRIDNLDIFSRAGANTALILSVPVTLTDGQLNIAFGPVIQQPKISAIEVLGGGAPSDTTRPTITSVTAVNANTVQVLFSEPVATTSAQTLGNYSLNNGVTNSSAVLGADTRTVTLTTSSLGGGNYTLTVNNVTDRASPPNAIVANSQAGFSFTPAGPDLPAPWQTSEIGNSLTGSANYADGSYTIEGAGNISGFTDNFHFVYQTLSADGEVKARVVSEQNTGTSARAGVTIRESLNNNSKHAMMDLSPDGTFRFQRRTSTGGFTTTSTSSGGTFPDAWVRLVRSGNTITAYRSANGSTWTQVGSATITMASNIYVGLGVASGSSGTLNTSVFDNVTVVP